MEFCDRPSTIPGLSALLYDLAGNEEKLQRRASDISKLADTYIGREEELSLSRLKNDVCECRYSIRHLAVGERPCKEAKKVRNCIAELIHK